MSPQRIQARHVFHPATSGWDRVHAWREATGEPAFLWGAGTGTGPLFGGIRSAFAAWLQGTDCPVTVYHDGAGADALGPLDPAPHKVLCLHHWFPRWEQALEWNLRCTGKVLVAAPGLADQLRQRFGWVPARFIHDLPGPAPAGQAARSAGHAPKARTGIWLQGRHWRRHGNRLRAMVDRWEEASGQLEIVAEGASAPPWARKPHIVWSAGLPFEFALNRLFTWDSTLLLQDFSLDAPWLLRALSLGCFPLVPDGDSPARTGHWQADDAPQPYPWGDVKAAIGLLAQWRKERPHLEPGFRRWVAGLQPERGGFAAAWGDEKSRIVEQRAIQLRARRPVPRWYPVGWYERVQRLRNGV